MGDHIYIKKEKGKILRKVTRSWDKRLRGARRGGGAGGGAYETPPSSHEDGTARFRSVWKGGGRPSGNRPHKGGWMKGETENRRKTLRQPHFNGKQSDTEGCESVPAHHPGVSEIIRRNIKDHPFG